MTPDAAPLPVLTGVGARRLLSSDERIVVVGAGGWLGLATLELLHGLLGERFDDRVVCFGSSARWLALRGGVGIAQSPLADLTRLAPAPSLVLHLAYLTQERAKAMSPEAYAGANRAISGQVLAALDPLGARGVFLPSSGAVHAVDDEAAAASVRLYGRLKLEDEARFAAWSDARGRPAAIARVFNLSGPYINKESSYALACFIVDALAGRPIQIRATRPVVRSYVAISELMSVVFGALTEGGAGPVLFDTAGEHEGEMADIARVVAGALGHGAGVTRPPMGAQAPDRYVGDGAAYRRLRDEFGVSPVSFRTQVLETAAFLADRARLAAMAD